MSSLTSDDRVGPNDPEYYAPPRWLRDRPEPRSLRERLAEAEAARASSMTPEAARASFITPPGSLDTKLESAVSKALWHKLDPEVIQDSPQLTSDLARRKALFTVAGRFAAAVGVSAAVALFFVIMIPAARQSDNGTLAGIVQSVKAMVIQPRARDEATKPAVAEFQSILTAAQNSQPVTPEQSGELLQQFVQWRQKPAPSQAP